MTQCLFLSSPYSHPNDAIREDRVRVAGDACAWLYRQGYLPMSPIVHWHHIALRNDLPTEAMAWTEWNRQWMYASDATVVLELYGWRDSQGIAMEVAWAEQAGKPVWRLVPSGQGGFEWKT